MQGHILMLGTFPMALALSAASPEQEPNRIVYWGNTQTGKTVRVFNKVNAEELAEAHVKAIGGTGWVLLENSTKPGVGVALCKLRYGVWHFYTAHGYPTGKEAVIAAKVKSNGGGSFCSNALWKVSETPPAKDPSAIDYMKGVVRSLTVTPKEEQTSCASSESSGGGKAELKPIGVGTIPVNDGRPPTGGARRDRGSCEREFPSSGIRG